MVSDSAVNGKRESTGDPSVHGNANAITDETNADVIRTVIHQMNNPLGVARMALHFIAAGRCSPEERATYVQLLDNALEKIQQGVLRLQELQASLVKYHQR